LPYRVAIVPFEESDADPSVWFIDHNYHENMAELFKKVSAKERPVGWYHTGGKLRVSDLRINELFLKYCPAPVLVVIDPTCSGPDLPFNSYFAIEEVKEVPSVVPLVSLTKPSR
jgi:26S proteasome regulatory subunit N8